MVMIIWMWIWFSKSTIILHKISLVGGILGMIRIRNVSIFSCVSNIWINLSLAQKTTGAKCSWRWKEVAPHSIQIPSTNSSLVVMAIYCYTLWPVTCFKCCWTLTSSFEHDPWTLSCFFQFLSFSHGISFQFLFYPFLDLFQLLFGRCYMG